MGSQSAPNLQQSMSGVLVHSNKQKAQAHGISSTEGTESQPAVPTAALAVGSTTQAVQNPTGTCMQCCSRQKADPEKGQGKSDKGTSSQPQSPLDCTASWLGIICKHSKPVASQRQQSKEPPILQQTHLLGVQQPAFGGCAASVGRLLEALRPRQTHALGSCWQQLQPQQLCQHRYLTVVGAASGHNSLQAHQALELPEM